MLNRTRIALAALAILALGGLARSEYSPIRGIMGPNSSTISNLACWGDLFGLSLTDCGAIQTPATSNVPTNAALKALTAGAFQMVTRTGYYANNDSPPAVYTWNGGSSCTDDGGSCIQPTVGAGRWILVPPTGPVDSRIFGAIADSGTTDNTTMFQNTWNYGSTIGQDWLFPATSNNQFSKFSAITVPAAAGSNIFVGSGRSRPLGWGKGSTLIKSTVTGGSCAITISLGTATFNYGSGGYMLQSATGTGQGLCLNGVAKAYFWDITLYGFTRGLFLIDVQTTTFERFDFIGNTNGLFASSSSGVCCTGPDKLTFLVPYFTLGGTGDGMTIVNGSNVTVFAAQFENQNAGNAAAGTSCGIHMSGGPSDGRFGLNLQNSFFSVDGGFAEVCIMAAEDPNGIGVTPGVHTIWGNEFDRNGATTYTKYEIDVDTGSSTQTTRLDIRGNSFADYNGYPVNALRPYINNVTSGGTLAMITGWGTNYVQSAASAPWSCLLNATGGEANCRNLDSGQIQQWKTQNVAAGNATLTYPMACPAAVDRFLVTSAVNGNVATTGPSSAAPGLSSVNVFTFNAAGANTLEAVTWDLLCH